MTSLSPPVGLPLLARAAACRAHWAAPASLVSGSQQTARSCRRRVVSLTRCDDACAGYCHGWVTDCCSLPPRWWCFAKAACARCFVVAAAQHGRRSSWKQTHPLRCWDCSRPQHGPRRDAERHCQQECCSKQYRGDQQQASSTSKSEGSTQEKQTANLKTQQMTMSRSCTQQSLISLNSKTSASCVKLALQDGVPTAQPAHTSAQTVLLDLEIEMYAALLLNN